MSLEIILQAGERVMRDPVFILGAHKSGTSLLRSLFDGHNDLLTLPIETHIAKYLGWWTKYPMKINLPSQVPGREAFISETSAWIDECNSASDRYSDSQALGIFDQSIFQDKISQLTETADEKQLIETYFSAIYHSTYKKSPQEGTRFTEKSVENVEHALRMNKIFTEAKFIHILRNPYANLVTLRKYMQKMHPSFPHLDKPIKSIRDSLYYAESNSQHIDKYLIIRYEDLVTDTEATMNKIAVFIGIPFEETLLAPSFLGAAWGGNSVEDGSFKGVSSARLDPWKQEINALEIQLTNVFLGNTISKYGYDIIPDRKGTLRRMKGERIKEYIGNRLQLKRPF